MVGAAVALVKKRKDIVMNRKYWMYFLLIAFVVGAVGSIVFGRIIIPWAATVTGWESLNQLVTSAPIVINRTTEVQLNEGVNLIELSRQIASMTVSIYDGEETGLVFRGLGTIMSSDGLIFTSKSAIGSNATVSVVLSDGRIFKGLVRAADPKSDLVVVTIEAQGLTSANFGSSFDLKTGQRVLTLGISNRAFERELNSGLITSTVLNNKFLDQPFHTEILANSFKTDLVFHSNYSGAPIANLEGRLVGMVINDRNQLMIGENLQTALNSYLQTGKIIRPKLGMQYLEVSALQANLRKLLRGGVLVVNLDRSSAAAEAGLQINDLIFDFNGTPLDNASFEQLLNQAGSGPIKLKLIRAGKEVELTVTLKPTQ
jgi:serine protease Do